MMMMMMMAIEKILLSVVSKFVVGVRFPGLKFCPSPHLVVSHAAIVAVSQAQARLYGGTRR
ncbi:hypothetical protein M9458_056629, partial [Cirrhinus mrigala]